MRDNMDGVTFCMLAAISTVVDSIFRCGAVFVECMPFCG